MENKEKKVMPYGKKCRVGNFFAVKYNKALRKSEVEALRTQMGIPADMRKNLQRATLPFIKVESISGIWAVEYCCNTSMYHMIDEILGSENEANMTTLHHIFNMWFMDTTIPGDNEYQEAKAAALKGFMERQKAKAISEEDDKKILDRVQNDEKEKATIVDMGKKISEDGGHEG